jgi:hypothetical protein
LALDPELKNAIHEVVKEENQPESVGIRLEKWLERMSERDLSVDDEMEFLETLRNALLLEAVPK